MIINREIRQLTVTKTPGRTGQVKAITLRRGENEATQIESEVLTNTGNFRAENYDVKFKAILPNGDMAEIEGTSGTGTSYNVYAVVTDQLTAVAGSITVAYFELTNKEDGSIITTDAIPIWVEPDADLSEGQYGEYQSHLDALLKQLEEHMADAAKAAEQVKAAEEATDRANKAADGVEAAAKSANDAAKNANDAATNADAATTKANDAAKAANDKATELQRKADAGDFDGATFTPSVADDGNISWTNNKGLENPATKNIKGAKGDKGDKGDPGSVTNLASHERVQMFYNYYVLKQQSVTPIIYVYLLGGDELKFSPKPITSHDRPLTASWQIKDTDNYFSTENDVPWFNYRSSILSINIDEIIIPKHIMRWFEALTNVNDISSLAMIDTSHVGSMTRVLRALRKVSDFSPIKDWNTSNATSFNTAFADNNLLQSVEPFRNWNTSKVNDMRYTFTYDSSVKDFSPINGWDVSKVTMYTGIFAETTGTRPTWGADW